MEMLKEHIIKQQVNGFLLVNMELLNAMEIIFNYVDRRYLLQIIQMITKYYKFNGLYALIEEYSNHIQIQDLMKLLHYVHKISEFLVLLLKHVQM